MSSAIMPRPFSPVLVHVACDDLPVGAVRELQRLVGGVGEQGGDPLLLPVGARRPGLEQDPAAFVERVVAPAAPAGRLAPQAAPDLGELVAGELDDVERVEDLDGAGHLAGGGLPVAGERIHRHDLHPVAERLRARGEPRGERLLAPALDHVDQTRRPAPPPRRER